MPAVEALRERLELHVAHTLETLRQLREEREEVEKRAAFPESVQGDCDYLDFFIGLFERAAVEIDRIAAELEKEVRDDHPERLRRIAEDAATGQQRCLEFFDGISIKIGQQLRKLRELDRIASDLEPVPPPTRMDRRSLFTQFFKR